MDDSPAIRLRRTYPVPPSRVFEAWRNPAILARWFAAPGWVAAVTSDFRVGGEYRIRMRDESGQGHVQLGAYLEIEPDSRLVFTWTCHELGVTDSVVTVELTERGDGTEMTLVHTLLPDAETRRLHDEGWRRCLGQLDDVLSQLQTEEDR